MKKFMKKIDIEVNENIRTINEEIYENIYVELNENIRIVNEYIYLELHKKV